MGILDIRTQIAQCGLVFHKAFQCSNTLLCKGSVYISGNVEDAGNRLMGFLLMLFLFGVWQMGTVLT